MSDTFGDRYRVEHDEAEVVAQQNSIAGVAGPHVRRRSARTAMLRPGVIQAGVVGLNGCVALLAFAIEGSSPFLIGTLATLNFALLVVFLLIDRVDRYLASRKPPYARRLQRTCFAGYVAAAVSCAVVLLAMPTGMADTMGMTLLPLVALAVPSCGYLAVSVAGYLLTEKQYAREIEGRSRRTGARSEGGHAF